MPIHHPPKRPPLRRKAVLVAQLREAVHGLNNVAAVLLSGWSEVRGNVGPDMAAEMDRAAERLLRQLADLTRLCLALSALV